MSNTISTAERILLEKIKEETGRECFKCCICGELFYGFGNNAYPIVKGGDCCDNCNETKVIPARIKALMHKEVNA